MGSITPQMLAEITVGMNLIEMHLPAIGVFVNVEAATSGVRRESVVGRLTHWPPCAHERASFERMSQGTSRKGDSLSGG